jgi:nucleoside-diphosphate-sugar epimerase
MKIFVTGATGFLGYCTAKALLQKGHSVSVLLRDKKEKEKFENFGFETAIGDLSALPDNCLAGIEAVFHFAAIRYEWGFSREEYWETNVQGTQNLLEASVQNKVKRFIYCSTAFVHGHGPKVLSETSLLDPKSLYALSKLEAEKLVQKYAMEKGLFSIILRPSMVYGPEDKTGMFLKLCRLIHKNRFFIIGNGKNKIHLSFIDDIVQGFLQALEHGNSGEAYIISQPETIALCDLVNVISRHLEVRPPGIKIPYWIAKTAGFIFEIIYSFGQKLGVQYFFQEPLVTRSKVSIIADSQRFDSTKAQKEFGFEAKMSYSEGISKTISWYKENGYLQN